MKKFLILALLALCVAGIGFSQVFVGGDIRYEHSSYNSGYPGAQADSSDLIDIRPIIGFSTGSLDLGLFLRYDNGGNYDVPVGGTVYERKTFGIGLSAYASLLNFDPVSVKAGLEVEKLWVTLTNTQNMDSPKEDTITVRLVPRVEFRLAQNLGIYANFGSVWYTHWSRDNGNQYKPTSNTFGISLYDNLSLGIKIYL